MGVILRKRRKIWSIDLAPGKPEATRGDEFASEPLSWSMPNRPPSACSTSQCCHPSRVKTYDLPIGSVSVCLKIQRILSKQKQRLLLTLKLSPRKRHEQLTCLPVRSFLLCNRAKFRHSYLLCNHYIFPVEKYSRKSKGRHDVASGDFQRHQKPNLQRVFVLRIREKSINSKVKYI